MKRSLSVLALSVLVSLVVGSTVSAVPLSDRVNEKVTICHRTHAVTNPYRNITVSMASIIGNGASGNGHGGGNHNPYYNEGGDAKPVFDPEFDYPANLKQWQDIIPPFNYRAPNGDTGNFPGLNWDTIGRAIYYGYVVDGVDYAGLCGKMSALSFYNLEYNSAMEDNPSANTGQRNQFKNDAISDLKDQEADEDGDIQNANDVLDLPDPAQKPRGAKVPPGLANLQASLDAENDGLAIDNPAMTQAIAGVVWVDADEDGEQDEAEELFEDVQVVLIDPTTGNPYVGLTETALRFNAAGNVRSDPIPATFTVYTDADGYFIIPDVPEGDWTLEVVTPDGYYYTYDSSDENDGWIPGTYVPAGGIGFASAGLSLGDEPSDGGGDDSGGGDGQVGEESETDSDALAATGVEIVPTFAFATALLFAGTLIRHRNRRLRH